ncbi:amidohydrolase family protein [Microvirga sp. GCM10011540]|uniref:amidohydrolase family protein n=1 Tax=Microvirga sp. GCM10011540 TaxID=3317338 RepID=UPI00360976CD
MRPRVGHAAGQWIQGRGYDQFELDARRHPLREEPDAVAPDHPVAIERACGYLAICNSKALELAGIDTRSAGSRHRAARRAIDGPPGRDRLKAVLPEPTDQEFVEAIDDVGGARMPYGISSVMDTDVDIRAGYREIARRGSCTVTAAKSRSAGARSCSTVMERQLADTIRL